MFERLPAGNPPSAPQPPRALIANALRQWIEQNEQAINGFTGSGTLPITVHFNTSAKNGAGEIRIMLGS